MFPYPSGRLHLGHVRVYGTSDVLARYFRMKGKNVFHPIGWDAFGLPAENAASERGKHPQSWTEENIAEMKDVMKKLNFSFDWDREFATCDPKYYKWTQYIFIKLFEKGLVYRKEAMVNWDPVDGTVLADEQIDNNGRSWRSGALAEKKYLKQWFVRTTAFSERLLEGLRDPLLKGWKDVIDIQKNWIGDADGTTIDFEVVDQIKGKEKQKISIWMKNPEFINKAKFVVVRAKSFWTLGCGDQDILPFRVKNPFTGDILPVYQVDSDSFFSDAEIHLGIPEVNEQDKAFADSMNIKYLSEKPGLTEEENLFKLREKICAEARGRGLGGYPSSSKLRDWLISRQRYWGTPIPVLYCENCGEQPVPEKDLPVLLPEVDLIGKKVNPLEKQTDWIRTICPNCGGPATRETDTMDTFVDSSWYYLRFINPDNERAAFDVEKISKLMPVDIYVGGKEHATLHLFYARFMNHFLNSLGIVPYSEPFMRFVCQAVVKSVTYKSKETGKYVDTKFVVRNNGNFFHSETKEALTEDWEKMSKSKYNSIEPMDLIAKWGADFTRLLILGASSPKSELKWNDNFSEDIFLWQKKLWLTVARFIELRSLNSKKPEPTEEYRNMEYYIFDTRNYYLKIICNFMENLLDIGSAIRKMWGFTSILKKCNAEISTHSVEFERALATQIILLAPFAPCFASELWAGFTKASNRLCNTGEILWDKSVFHQPWPQLDTNYKNIFQNMNESTEGLSEGAALHQNPALNRILLIKKKRNEKNQSEKNKKKVKQ